MRNSSNTLKLSQDNKNTSLNNSQKDLKLLGKIAQDQAMGSGFLIDNVKDTSMVKSSKSRDLEEKLKASVNKSNISDPNAASIADLSKSQK